MVVENELLNHFMVDDSAVSSFSANGMAHMGSVVSFAIFKRLMNTWHVTVVYSLRLRTIPSSSSSMCVAGGKSVRVIWMNIHRFFFIPNLNCCWTFSLINKNIDVAAMDSFFLSFFHDDPRQHPLWQSSMPQTRKKKHSRVCIWCDRVDEGIA